MRKHPANYELVNGAWIHSEAQLADDVVVEPGAVIDAGVEVGAGTWIGSGAVLYGPTKIGVENEIYPGAIIGGPPQDIGYAGEPTRLEIGDHNVFREGFSANRASTKCDQVTRIGDHNFFMADSHVAHDVILGNHVIAANGVLIAGHCEIGDHVNFAGRVAISQFVTVGRHAFVAGLTGARKDVEPFLCHDFKPPRGPEAEPQCVNQVGLKRSGFAPEVIKKLRISYRVLFLREGFKDPAASREELMQRDAMCAEVDELISFLERKRAGQGRQISAH